MMAAASYCIFFKGLLIVDGGRLLVEWHAAFQNLVVVEGPAESGTVAWHLR
jgi:hypothetical protein